MPNLDLLLRADDQATRRLVEVTNALKQAGGSSLRFGEQAAQGSSRADEAFQKNRQGALGLLDRVTDLKSAFEIVFAGAIGSRVIGFLRESLREYGESERAVNNLAQALKSLGANSKLLVDEQVKFAEQLQRTTIFSDEQVLSAQSMMVSFGIVGEELKRATQAAADFATATGRDISSAAFLLGKAAAGSTDMLARYGIIISDTIPKGERFAAVLSQIGERFGGRAQADANTYLGSMAQLGNAFSNLKESIGAGVLPAAKLYSSILSELIDNTLGLIQAQNRDLTVKQAAVNVIQQEVAQDRELLASEEALSRLAASTIEIISKRLAANERLLEVSRQRANEETKAEKAAADREAKEAKAEAERRRRASEAGEIRKRANDEEQKITEIARAAANERIRITQGEAAAQIAIEQQKTEAKKLELLRLSEAGTLSAEQVQKAFEDLEFNTTENIRKIREGADENFKAVKEVSEAVSSHVSSRFASAFADIVLDGKSMEEAMKGIFRSIARVAIEEFTRIQIQRALASAGGLGGIGALAGFGAFAGFAGGFAHGTARVPGPMGAPRLALVHGGEQIVPPGGAAASTSGPSGGGNTVINVNLRVADLDPFERQKVVSALVEEIRAATDPARQLAGELSILTDRTHGRAT